MLTVSEHLAVLASRWSINYRLSGVLQLSSGEGRHAATSMLRCAHCREWFVPDRYNAHHQRYCSKGKRR